MFSFLRPASPKVKRIAPAEAVARAERGELTILDVRELSELKTSGKARGAVHVPLATVPIRMKPGMGEVPEGVTLDRPICLYCAAGGRSGRAAEVLLGLGYTEVYNLGGFGDWLAGGGKTEKI
ncbi:rhodanese-like domain-containing protein [Gemmobacter aquaticus]|jgi:rhodanese-related sulfurtransferase|uniref:Rhodanese-like domain-containing protein n=1 Tax=Gemmobacter aquaticus TaxID=490185 RepID=A0A917YH89_9RHOB|nr:rhodanese-like domain-containing protein [Gemmobacter aquaticus]GGO25467.1 rhodanese-like domain-containing protein [Gemmobacter aquaticus]